MTEFADRGGIMILRRTAAGKQQRLRLDYHDALDATQAIELLPGDTVVVP
jgi:hypothetical protein